APAACAGSRPRPDTGAPPADPTPAPAASSCSRAPARSQSAASPCGRCLLSPDRASGSPATRTDTTTASEYETGVTGPSCCMTHSTCVEIAIAQNTTDTATPHPASFPVRLRAGGRDVLDELPG